MGFIDIIFNSTLYNIIISVLFLILGLISLNKIKRGNDFWKILGIICFLIVLIFGLNLIKNLS